MNAQVRVLVVDDDPLVREGLTMMLDGAGGIRVVGQAGDGDEIPRGTDRERVDVVLMDLRMRREGGIAATRRLRQQARPPEVVVLTTFDTDGNIVEALRAGASGFLLKDTPPTDIVRAVHAVAAGEPMLSPTVVRRLMDRTAASAADHGRARELLGRLTTREREIALSLGRGRTNAQIADELYLSVATIKANITRILDKLDLDNRTQVALLIQEAGV